MRCEDCDFDLPYDWPLTGVEVVDAPGTEHLRVGPPLVVQRLLCNPCGRGPKVSSKGPLIDYRVLPPHESAGKKR